MKIKAFTLTELLIALAVVGILIAILLPIIFSLIPDQNALIAKRAYYTIQTVTSSLLNDEACYPDKSQANSTDARVGFDDGYGYADCYYWGGKYNEGYITTEDANSKFATLFMNKLDLKGYNSNSIYSYSSGESVPTKDNVTWFFENLNLSHSNSNPYIDLLVDVNGNGGPNCRNASDTNGDNCSKKKDFDRFTVRISANGNLNVIEEWAKNAIGINADITGANK